MNCPRETLARSLAAHADRWGHAGAREHLDVEGRTGGLLGSWFRDESLPAEHGWEAFVDERWGHSADQELIERYVIEASELERFGDASETCVTLRSSSTSKT